MITYRVYKRVQLNRRYVSIILLLSDGIEYRSSEDRISSDIDDQDHIAQYDQRYLQMLWEKAKPITEDKNIEIVSALHRESLSKGAMTSKTLWPVIEAFNDPLEQLAKARQLTLDSAYTSYRSVFDALPLEVKTLMNQYTNAHTLRSFSFVEPGTLNDSYKVQFNSAIRDFLVYVTLRALT